MIFFEKNVMIYRVLSGVIDVCQKEWIVLLKKPP